MPPVRLCSLYVLSVAPTRVVHTSNTGSKTPTAAAPRTRPGAIEPLVIDWVTIFQDPRMHPAVSSGEPHRVGGAGWVG